MPLSTKECAEILQVTDKTIRNYIKSGKISASRDDDNNYIIEESEFYRVFPERKPKEKVTDKSKEAKEEEPPVLKTKIALLEEKNNSLFREIEILKEQLADYKSRESKLMEMANTTTKLLTYSEENKKKKRWFGR